MQTQADVARQAGISEGFLSQILSGTRRPRWKKAKRLAKATETTPDLWLEGAPAEIREATGLKKPDCYKPVPAPKNRRVGLARG